MGICWYCYWGWPKQVRAIYNEARGLLGDSQSKLEYGPAHIVWDDENFDSHSIQWCLDHFDEHSDGLSQEESSIIKWSLLELIKIPEPLRCIEPPDYDGENPAKYPPPDNFEME